MGSIDFLALELNTRKTARVASLSKLVLVLTLAAAMSGCADSPRENVVDPVVAPTIEMSTPVLDGGTILIEWRYLAEGDAVAEFEVRRITDGEEPVTIGRVDATASLVFVTASIRDSSLVAGVPVRYEVRAIDTGGEVTGTASDSITIRGTSLTVVVDSDDLAVRLSWTGEPEGTIGYRLRRRTGEDPYETIFVTDLRSVRSHGDSGLEGGSFYTYKLETILSD